MAKERILITVKTYPTLSRTYGETVCTAGIREDGSWVRLYPVPFRRLDEAQQYRKYDWIECRLQRNNKDPRPESCRPLDPAELVSVDHIDTADEWRDRRRLILNQARVYSGLDELIAGAKDNRLSLAVFKPARILDFVWEQEDREWDADKLRQMREMYKQMDMFEENDWRKTFQIIPKLPYSFSYRFEDADGRKSKMQILDWEVGALFWNCMKACDNDETRALEKVRAKYLDEFLTKDLHFFLGTTQQFHFVAPNPWVVIGVFPVPHKMQDDLFS
jgi:hypothetical protein